MNFYQRNIGDYARDCRFLTMIQDGAYTRLMDWYYKNERPLPVSIRDCCLEVGAKGTAERAAVAYILEKYFSLLSDGHHKNRCDEEIAAVYAKSDKARASAEARWGREKVVADHAKAMRSHSVGNAPSMLPITHDPGPNIGGANAPPVDRPINGRVRPQLELVESVPELPDCPHQDIIALYRKHLPGHRQPVRWDGERAEAMRVRWRECSRPTPFGDGYATKADGIAFWDRFFAHVAATRKLRDGITSTERGETRTWRPDLPWLVAKGNFTKVVEGAYK